MPGRRPEQIAIRCGDSALTYGELWNYSDGWQPGFYRHKETTDRR